MLLNSVWTIVNLPIKSTSFHCFFALQHPISSSFYQYLSYFLKSATQKKLMTVHRKKDNLSEETEMDEPCSFAALQSLDIDGSKFPATLTPPASDKSLFLGGAGVRGVEIEGRFVKFTTIGVYLEKSAVKSLASKWRGKSAEELTDTLHFYEDIITGPFDKFARVTMVMPLTGVQYSEKVSENCVNLWKEIGIYTDTEAEAVAKFKEVFKSRNFPPGASLLFGFSASGDISIAFSEGDLVPEKYEAVIENKALCLAVFDSMIGKHGVSPAAKCSLAFRLAKLFNNSHQTTEEANVGLLHP